MVLGVWGEIRGCECQFCVHCNMVLGSIILWIPEGLYEGDCFVNIKPSVVINSKIMCANMQLFQIQAENTISCLSQDSLQSLIKVNDTEIKQF